MKNIFKLLLLIFALPLIAFAVDSYNYDRSINIPSAAVDTSQTPSDDLVCAKNNTGDGEAQYQRIQLSLTSGADYTRVEETYCSNSEDPQAPAGDPGSTGEAGTGTVGEEGDPGLTFQGTVNILAYALIGNREYLVNTAEVEAKTNITTGSNRGMKVIGDCITDSQGRCDMRINSPLADLDFAGNQIINYTAAKGESIGTTSANFANSKDQTVKIQINGLTEAGADEYIDWTAASNPNRLQIPGARGFIGGEGSITIVPTRYTTIGGNGSSTPVGGVTFDLQVYYNTGGTQRRSSAESDVPLSYQTTAGSFAYTTRNTLSSLFGGSQKYSLSGTIPDNGSNSRIQISNLPEGAYLLSLKKDGFQTTTITFELNDSQKKTLNGINLRPKKGAEQPSINQNSTVRRIADINVYWVNIGGDEYLYDPEYPWYGWQKNGSYITQEPTYNIGTNYEPSVPMGSRTTGGYDTPWGQGSGNYADYMQGCQTANYGSGADPKNAAIAAAIGGLGTFLNIDSRDQNLGSFAETTLIPGLSTYFAAKAIGDSGGSISVTTGNADCYPTSPLLNDNYNPNSYYPNNYQTSNIPDRCRVCFDDPLRSYLVDPCPRDCLAYRATSNTLPVLDILRQLGIGF